MRARDFNGSTDLLSRTVAALDSGAVSVGCWFYADSTGEGELGTLINVTAAGRPDGIALRCAGFGLNLFGWSVPFGSSDADDVYTQSATSRLVTGAWQCIVATADGGTNPANMAIWLGTQSAAMAQPGTPFSTQSGAGSRLTSVTAARIGTNGDGSATWDGRIAHPFIVPWQMTQAEAEAYRLGRLGALLRGGTPRSIVQLSAGAAVDLADSTLWTATGTTDIEGPPVNARLGVPGVLHVQRVVPATGVSIPVLSHSYRRRRAA
ncbi:MAG: hypothetical protein AB7H43_10680 [Acidimicrobiia bacterium]